MRTAPQTHRTDNSNFSLRAVFFGIVAVAVGLAIWRLPKGDWIDVPLATLSLYFAVSLLRHAAHVRRLLAESAASPHERAGGRLLCAGLVALSAALVIAWTLRWMAAGEYVLVMSEEPLQYVHLPTLPRDLAVLAMLAAVTLPSWQSARSKPASLRRGLLFSVAVIAGIVVALVYWVDRSFIPFLVYIAVSGIENAQPARLLPPERITSAPARIHRFTLVTSVGVALIVLDLLLISNLAHCWDRPRRRRLLIGLLAIGLAVQCWIAGWIGARGVKLLAPPFVEAVRVSPDSMALAALMALLVAAAVSWGALAKPMAPPDRSSAKQRRLFFHETSLASLLLAAAVMAPIVVTMVRFINPSPNPWGFGGSGTIDFQTIIYGLTFYPAQFIWIAAVIGPIAIALKRWRNPRPSDLPSINPAQFAALTLGLFLWLVRSAAVIAAASFSFWLIRF